MRGGSWILINLLSLSGLYSLIILLMRQNAMILAKLNTVNKATSDLAEKVANILSLSTVQVPLKSSSFKWEKIASDEDYENFVKAFKQATRHYAKRQLTWFRKEPLFRWLDVDMHDPEVVFDIIKKDYETL